MDILSSSQPELTFTNLSEAEVDFIQKNLQLDVNQLLLKSSKPGEFDFKKLAGQILSRQKATKKLPDWVANKYLIFPPSLSVEQSSSQATALFKSSLMSGKSLMDITGGMGVDFFYSSKNFERAIYFEMQEVVAKTTAHNFEKLGVKNVEIRNENSLEAIVREHLQSDWIYTDPARRDQNKDKVVRLADCTPDIVANLELLLQAAPNILIKTSPLLDINLAIKELNHVKAVYAVGYDQECKELLFHIQKGHEGEAVLHACVVDNQGHPRYSLQFDRNEEHFAQIHLSGSQSYLYEPHAAVLKSGAFKVLGERYGVNKLAMSSHLYTSNDLVPNFPGRAFEIIGVTKPDANEIRKVAQSDKANLTLRNFPGKIQDLRKKWRLKDGGDIYLFATTLFDNKKVVIVSKKVN